MAPTTREHHFHGLGMPWNIFGIYLNIFMMSAYILAHGDRGQIENFRGTEARGTGDHPLWSFYYSNLSRIFFRPRI